MVGEPTHTPTEPEGKYRKPRKFWLGGYFVWVSSDYSRAVGLVSGLAIVETILAVAVYWAIAGYWDTHIHLVGSLFIAPLLLLRSHDSIKLGVQWFERDWLDLENYKTWPGWRKGCWRAFCGVIGFACAFLFARWAVGAWLSDSEGWPFYLIAAGIGALAALIGLSSGLAAAVAAAPAAAKVGAAAIAAAIAAAAAGWGAGAGAVAVAGAAAGAGAGAAAAAAAVAVAVVVVVVVVVVGAAAAAATIVAPGFAAGMVLRALTVRIMATVRYFFPGWNRLARNWRENAWGIDGASTIELLPGIENKYKFLTSSGFFKNFVNDKYNLFIKIIYYGIFFIFLFVPGIFYRWSIKSTAWVYWVLAYLLWPVQVDQPRTLLTSPWGNGMRRYLLIVLLVLGGGQFIALYSHGAVTDIGLHPLLGALLALLGALPDSADPSGVAPWRWLLVVAAVPALILLVIGSWQAHRYSTIDPYRPSGWLVSLLVYVNRTHYLSLIALLVAFVMGFALGHYPEVMAILPSGQAQ